MNNTLAVAALGVAAVALIISLIALNRTSEENLQEVVDQQVEETLQELFGPPLPDQSDTQDDFEVDQLE